MHQTSWLWRRRLAVVKRSIAESAYYSNLQGSQQGKPGRFLLANYDLLAQTHNRVWRSLCGISPSGAAKHFVLTLKSWNRSHIKVMERSP
jgi:hypothetical protein